MAHCEVIDPIVKDAVRLPYDLKYRYAIRFPGQLFVNQPAVVEIEMRIAAHPDELTGQQIGLLRRPSRSVSPAFQPSRPASGASPGANQRVASRRPTTAPPGAARSSLFGWVVAPAGLGLGSLPALSRVRHC